MELLFLGCEGVAWRDFDGNCGQSGDDQGDSQADFVPSNPRRPEICWEGQEFDDFQQ